MHRQNMPQIQRVRMNTHNSHFLDFYKYFFSNLFYFWNLHEIFYIYFTSISILYINNSISLLYINNYLVNLQFSFFFCTIDFKVLIKKRNDFFLKSSLKEIVNENTNERARSWSSLSIYVVSHICKNTWGIYFFNY